MLDLEVLVVHPRDRVSGRAMKG